jgi:hypothetical protein
MNQDVSSYYEEELLQRQNWGRCRNCNKGGLLMSRCNTCNQDGIKHQPDLVNMYRKQKITGKELEDRVIQVMVTSTKENEVELFFKVISEMMGIDNENLNEAFVMDRCEMLAEVGYSRELEYNNVQQIIRNSYYLNEFDDFETDDHNYLSISQCEFFCMLEVGTIWLLNQYLRDLPIAPINNC